MLQPEPQPIRSCTISRDVQKFDLLIEDMEGCMGESWGDLGFEDTLAFLEEPAAGDLEFLAIAVDEDDETDIGLIVDIVRAAKDRSIRIILVIGEEVSPTTLHTLMREGGDEFVPYPLPEGELAGAIDRVSAPPQAPAPVQEVTTALRATDDCSGVVIPVHGMAGGTGATTLAVNLAWELAGIGSSGTGSGRKTRDKTHDKPPKVCLIDLDFQFGSTSTFLDLPRREAVFELLQDTEAMDSESFMQALQGYEDKLHVLTAPTDLIPLDLVTPTDIERVIETARINFDYVIIDMPKAVVGVHRPERQEPHQAVVRKPRHFDRGADVRRRPPRGPDRRSRRAPGRGAAQDPAAQGDPETGDIGSRAQRRR
jgi:pilus assembly protein CpaE